MTDDQRERIEAAIEEGFRDISVEGHATWDQEQSLIEARVIPVIDSLLAAQAAEIAAKDQRIAELEGLIREVLNSDGNVLTMSLGCRMEEALASAALSPANPNQGASDGS